MRKTIVALASLAFMLAAVPTLAMETVTVCKDGRACRPIPESMLNGFIKAGFTVEGEVESPVKVETRVEVRETSSDEVESLRDIIALKDAEIDRLTRENALLRALLNDQGVENLGEAEEVEGSVTLENTSNKVERRYDFVVEGEDFDVLSWTEVAEKEWYMRGDERRWRMRDIDKQAHDSFGISAWPTGGFSLRPCENIDALYEEFSDTTYPVRDCPGKYQQISDEDTETHGYTGHYINWHGDEVRTERLRAGHTYRVTATPDGKEKLYHVKLRGVESGKVVVIRPSW